MSDNTENKKKEIVKKNKKKVFYIMSGVSVVVSAIAICMLSGCFSKKPIEPQAQNIVPVKQADTKKFVQLWNKKIYKIKYENIRLGVDFEKYEINATNAQDKISSFLHFSTSKDQHLAEEINSKDLSVPLMPIKKWIDLRAKVPHLVNQKMMNSTELMRYVEKGTRSRTFSNNAISKVIQFNEFCYYFEKQKDILYREGYTRNMKSCDQFQEIIDEYGLSFSIKN